MTTKKMRRSQAWYGKLDRDGFMCLKEHLVPLDIVDATLFLASKASRMMTGQTRVVDGALVVTG
ncbi:hypothetical protein [Marinobacterium sedimentorum]|uniref:hypothetical protein n=1 Tax=Marinobacterium sedimentorum TaxID=2927804 RepID=UPI0020C7454D|nr:hypothetical protein [Marinobacterium sedimentorum]MCP8686377.1 hypothetical protein [Marinobacterium sedimentorum]